MTTVSRQHFVVIASDPKGRELKFPDLPANVLDGSAGPMEMYEAFTGLGFQTVDMHLPSVAAAVESLRAAPADGTLWAQRFVSRTWTQEHCDRSIVVLRAVIAWMGLRKAPDTFVLLATEMLTMLMQASADAAQHTVEVVAAQQLSTPKPITLTVVPDIETAVELAHALGYEAVTEQEVADLGFLHLVPEAA